MQERCYRLTVKAGFTLLEMAVVLVIIASACVLFARQPPQPIPSGCRNATQAEIVVIRNALEHFVWANKRYPTPASRSAGVGSTLYGRETSGVDIDSYPNGSYPILFGSLPFETLGLPTTYAADCWGNQFTYVVTQELTSQTGFALLTNVGGITVNSGTLTAHQTIIPNAAYAVISHGETGGESGNGAVPPNHKGSHAWCANDGILDHENCSINNAVLYAGSANNGAVTQADFFDDLILASPKPVSHCNTASTPVSWTVGGVACTGNFSGPTADGDQKRITSTGTNIGAATYACSSGTPTLSAAISATCAAPVPLVNGSCGTASGQAMQLLPVLNLCTSGTATVVLESASLFSWTCKGTGGGTHAPCSATPVCKCGGITLICINPRNPFGGLNLLGINVVC